jgi:hypothetical protein
MTKNIKLRVYQLIDAALVEIEYVEYGVNEACIDNEDAWDEERSSIREAKDLLYEAQELLI